MSQLFALIRMKGKSDGSRLGELHADLLRSSFYHASIGQSWLGHDAIAKFAGQSDSLEVFALMVDPASGVHASLELGPFTRYNQS